MICALCILHFVVRSSFHRLEASHAIEWVPLLKWLEYALTLNRPLQWLLSARIKFVYVRLNFFMDAAYRSLFTMGIMLTRLFRKQWARARSRFSFGVCAPVCAVFIFNGSQISLDIAGKTLSHTRRCVASEWQSQMATSCCMHPRGRH